MALNNRESIMKLHLNPLNISKSNITKADKIERIDMYLTEEFSVWYPCAKPYARHHRLSTFFVVQPYLNLIDLSQSSVAKTTK